MNIPRGKETLDDIHNIPRGEETLDDIHYSYRLFGLLFPKDF